MREGNKANKEKQVKIHWKEFFHIYKGIKLPWLLFCIILAIGFIEGWVFVKESNFEQKIMNGTDLSAKVVIPYLLICLAVPATIYSLQYLRDGVCVEYINRDMRKKLWNKLIYIPASFYDKETPDSLVSRITSDCEGANSLVVQIVGLIAELSALVLSFRALWGYSTKLLGYMVIGIVMIFIYGLAISKVEYWAKYMVQRYFSPFTSYIAQRLKAFNLVKSSCMEEEEYEEGSRIIKDMFKADAATSLALGLRQSFANLTQMVSITIVFVGGSIMMKQGIIDSGTIVAFYNLAQIALGEVMMYFQAFVNIKGGQGSLAKVVKIMDVDAEDILTGEHIDIPDNDITFSDVDFGYTENRQILNHVSFTIPKGKMTAIIGANGEGKTTILKLLERYYEPQRGEIRFGGENIASFSKKEWRQMLGYTSQDSPLLYGTLRDNITYGSEREISDEELRIIAAKANIAELVDGLPEKFDTVIDDGGANLSGGERQRLTIARAIAKNPEYMLLDEATCNLDPMTERDVQGALENMMDGRTVVVIAHSYTTVKNADNIVVVENGTVTCQGTQDEVREKSRFFNDFVESAAV